MAADLQEQLYSVMKEAGAALVGAADLEGFVKDDLTIGVSAAVPLPAPIVEDVKAAPTPEYYRMYHELNARLDRIVEAGASFLRERGYRARANVKKSVTVGGDLRSPLPHKTVAVRAGLGWIGKSCLLVTEEYGSAVRISSLVTDAPLLPGVPFTRGKCGSCHVCVDQCPGQALRGTLWTAGMPREELLDAQRCRLTQIARMQETLGFSDGDKVCGRCFAVCTYTQRYLKREKI